MSKKDRYDDILKAILSKVTTWDSFYEYLDSRMAAIRDTMHPVIVFDTLFMMQAFFVAMRENPEESDITVLVTKMVHTLVYDSVDKLGVDLEIVTEQTARNLAAAHAELALRMVGEDAPKTFH